MNFQHKLAITIANFLDDDTSRQDTNHILLIYGIEVFLNEFLKLVVSLLIAWLIGLLPQAAFASVYLLLLRRYAGGRHFESNLACSLFSFTVIVIFPGIGMHLLLPTKIRYALIIGTAALLVSVVPFLKKDEQMENKEKLKRKVITLFIYFTGLFLGYCVGEIHFLQGAIFVSATVAITAISVPARNNMIG